MMILLMFVWVHFLADFVLQSNKMAINKSSSLFYLTQHVIVYTFTLIIVSHNIKFALLNGAAHWVVDLITSRITTSLYKKGKRHLFFVVIGLDQAIHMSCLILTIGMLR